MWDTSKLEIEACFFLKHWILSLFHCKDICMSLTLINIYMPTRHFDKIGCWNSLYAIKETLALPSCIVARDFNTILFNL
jgi:hypothetical protein